MKTKVQAFVDNLDATAESITVSGENVEVKQLPMFSYIGSVIHLSTGIELDVN